MPIERALKALLKAKVFFEITSSLFLGKHTKKIRNTSSCAMPFLARCTLLCLLPARPHAPSQRSFAESLRSEASKFPVGKPLGKGNLRGTAGKYLNLKNFFVLKKQS